jgi:RimJ/RimL family protein N-acetyltransferase
MNPIIETPRLALREMTLDDLDFVAEMVAHPEVMRFYPKRYSRDEARGWIERQQDRYARHGHGLWLVQDRATGEPRGMVGLMMQHVEGIDEPEVGYLIHYPYWRQGFAAEAAAASRDYAFNVRGYPHVISLIRPINLPSRAVARKNGLKPWKHTMHAGYLHVVFRRERNSSDDCKSSDE